jgi:hypothetical protein
MMARMIIDQNGYFAAPPALIGATDAEIVAMYENRLPADRATVIANGLLSAAIALNNTQPAGRC